MKKFFPLQDPFTQIIELEFHPKLDGIVSKQVFYLYYGVYK